MTEDDTRATSIAWVRQHVDQRIMGLAGLIGGETGDMEKRLREQMKAHVTDETGMLLKVIEVQGRKIAALEAKLTKTATTGKRK